MANKVVIPELDPETKRAHEKLDRFLAELADISGHCPVCGEMMELKGDKSEYRLVCNNVLGHITIE